MTGFVKRFKNPIEKTVSAPYGNAQWVGKPMNLESATGKGIEVNLRKSLKFIAPGTFLQHLYVNANAMYMKMEVNYEQRNNKRDSVRQRPLQDLVPWSVNAGIAYNGKVFGAAVNYSTQGRKLVQSATSEMADEYGFSGRYMEAQIMADMARCYLEKIKNPYCFRCGDAVVSIHFADKGNSLDSLLKNYFLGLKRS